MKRKILRTCLRMARQYLPKHPNFNYKSIHYSFVIQNNKIVEWAVNKGTECDYIIKMGYPEYSNMHSEVAAWKKACGLIDRRRPFQMVNIRLNKYGQMRKSKPCPCCKSFLRSLGCSKVIYTNELGFAKMP